MNTKTWVIFGAVCVALLGGLIALSRQGAISVDDVDQTKVLAASERSGNIADHVYGKADSKVVLIEYGDFQCPGCASAAPNLKALSEEFKDDIAFVFRNNPLPTIHANARAAAAAAEAAGLQGKYWEMHDLLYAQQTTWQGIAIDKRTDAFVNYAQQVGVTDIEKFKTDMGSDAVGSKINFDLALGKKARVTGTPTILLNNEKIESDVWNDQAKFKAKIEEALK